MAFRRFFKPQYTTNPNDVRMTLGEHLDELRSRLIRALIALGLGALVCYLFIDQIFGFLARPLFAVLVAHGLPPQVNYFDITEVFMMDIKLALIVGFMLTAPYSLSQIWGFIAAGLYPHERVWVRRFIPVSIALFFIGAIFFLIVVMPIFLKFFIEYGEKRLPDYNIPSLVDTTPVPLATSQTATQPSDSRIAVYVNDPPSTAEGEIWINRTVHEIRTRVGDQTYAIGTLRKVDQGNRIVPTIRIADYMLLVLQMAAAFGIGFQIPVVVAVLSTLGIVSAAEMGRVRKYVWFGIAVAAAIITPSPDVTSMMLLFVPMIGLYEAGLVVARSIERKNQQKSTA